VDAILISGGWCHRAALARTPAQRLVGLMGRHSPESMLFQTRSVHGFGMGRPVAVMAIGHDSTVIGSKVLAPNRMVIFGRARYLLELPVEAQLPPAGAPIEIGFEDG
jgi:uncharacterized membrane protein (UPF0127 family)